MPQLIPRCDVLILSVVCLIGLIIISDIVDSNRSQSSSSLKGNRDMFRKDIYEGNLAQPEGGFVIELRYSNAHENHVKTCALYATLFYQDSIESLSLECLRVRNDLHVFDQINSSSLIKLDNDVILGTIKSNNVVLDGRRVDTISLGKKIVRYSLFQNVLTMILIRLYFHQMNISEEGSGFSKVSLLTVIALTMYDFFDGFYHLFIGISSSHFFNAFIFVALFKFALCFLVEMRLMILIVKAGMTSSELDDDELVRNRVSQMYSRFYLIAFFSFVLVLNVPQVLYVFFVLFSLAWIPQILLNISHGYRNSFSAIFIAGVIGCRYMICAYILGCPSSLLASGLVEPYRLEQNILAYIIVTVLSILQLILLLTQSKYGTRWFVPWICLPHVYNYTRMRPPEKDMENNIRVECVICMYEITDDDICGLNYAITPCDHFFHENCLLEWMNIKMECPTCRGNLPLLEK